jgi:hypothetical protein
VIDPKHPVPNPVIHLGYLDDQEIIGRLRAAVRRISFVGPGLSKAVSEVLSQKWNDLGAKAVQVIIEADADVCRLGYGDGESLSILLSTSEQLGGSLLRQPGIRLCILEVDDERMIYPATPRLVEAAHDSATSVVMPVMPESPSSTLRESIFSSTQETAKPLSRAAVSRVDSELRESPPQPFDLARQVRVLSTRFQFAEFTLERVALSRQRVPVPPDLLGLGSDEKVRELLQATFQLVDRDSELSGDKLLKRKAAIEKKFLVNIANYGKVIIRSGRPEFDQAVEGLRAEVCEFQRQAREKLNDAIKKNLNEVIARLLPVVISKPPERWLKWIGTHPTKDQLRRRLEDELRSAYGNADDYFGRMDVRLVYKDITVEMLRDPDFAKAAEKAKLYLNEMYEEFEAARARAKES